MPRRGSLFVLLVSLAGLTALGVGADAQVSPWYELPNNDGNCPAGCRQIPWRAGSDLWNAGALPRYSQTQCSGLVEGNGTTDNTSTIQACINSAPLDTAVYIPAGMYYVNGQISLRSRVVLRGAGGGKGAQGTWISSTYRGDVGSGATVTTLKFGPGGYIKTPGSSTLSTPVLLSSGFTKGSTVIVTASAPGLAVGDWIIVSQKQGDTEIPVTWSGANGSCTWCGESNNSGYLMSQIVQVTSVSGNSIGISRPLYYTFKASLAPRLRELNIGGQRTGVEDMKLWASTNSRTEPHISVDGCVYCWVKGVETYNTPDVGKAYPVYMEYSYGNEVRDSYFHYGQGNSGDRNYGIGMFGPNSDHKVENNIFRENRHSWSQEGGGSGNVFLYNYVDDNYTNDTSFLGSPRVNHGAHPYMTLFEGNVVSHFASDNFWGSSSHVVLFRNWLWGDASGNYSAWTSSSPDWGFVALELDQNQHFYSAVGNVLGNPNLHTNWANATLMNTACGYDSSRSAPVVYGFGCVSQSGSFDAAVRSTMILHGNYDFKTRSIAHWDGGSVHLLKPSMYYNVKPAFLGNNPWPAFGPDLTPITGTIPAKERFEGKLTISGPLAPTNVRIIKS